MNISKNLINISYLEKSYKDINRLNSYEARIDLKEISAQILIEPDDIFCIKTEIPCGMDLLPKYSLKLLQQQSEFIYPIKLTLSENLVDMGVLLELPLMRRDSLSPFFDLLKKEIFQVKRVVTSILKETASITKYKIRNPKQGRIHLKDAKVRVEDAIKMCYEYSAEENGWIISINSKNYYQRIEVLLDSTKKILRVQAKVIRIPGEQTVSLMAIPIFLLQSTVRTRYVRGMVYKNKGSDEYVFFIGTTIPFDFLEAIKPDILIESVIAATHFIRLPCEALLCKPLAEAYLNNVGIISPAEA
jgi:hypothetical protein